MKAKKWLIQAVPILSASLLLAACANSNNNDASEASSVGTAGSTASAPASSAASGGEKVELTFVNWASAEESTKDKIAQVIAAFEQENPNITIKSVPIPFTDIENQLTVMTAAGNAPDIAQVENSIGISLGSMGALESVDGLLSSDFASDVNTSYYDSGLLNDQHVLIPWSGGTNGFWYNKTILQQAGLDPNNPPKTLQELETAMVAIKKLPGDIVPLQYDTTARAFSVDFQWPWFLALGGEPFDGEKADVGSLADYAKWLRDLVAKGYTLPGKKLGEFRPLAAQNRLAFAVDAPFLKGTIQSLDPSITDQVFYDTWGVTTLPAGNGGQPYTVGGSDHYLAVFKASKHKAEAVKFLEYLANSDESLQDYIIPMGYLPVTASALTRFQQQFDNPITKSFIEDIVPTTVVPPFGPNFTKAASILGTDLQSVITTSNPIDGILQKTQDKLSGVLGGS